MRVLQVAAAVIVAFLVHTLVGRYILPLRSYLDLFLVVTAGFGLLHGRVAGMGAGTVAGLVQDTFSGGKQDDPRARK